MIPGNYDITVYRGGTFSIDFSATDEDGPINFSTTYTEAKLEVYPAWLNTSDDLPLEPIYEMNTTNGLIILGGTSGTLYIPAENTQALPFQSGSYKLKFIIDVPIAPIVDILLRGIIRVEN